MLTRNLKKGILLLVGMVFLVGLAAQPAMAFGKKKTPKKEKTVRKAVMRNMYPPMVFKRGRLTRDHDNQWFLNGKPLKFAKASQIGGKTDSGRSPVLQEGREAFVMGYYKMGVMVVHRLQLLDVNESIKRGTFAAQPQTGGPQPAPDDDPR